MFVGPAARRLGRLTMFRPTSTPSANANAATSSHEEVPHIVRSGIDARLRPDEGGHRKRLAHQTSSPPKPPGRNDMKHTS